MTQQYLNEGDATMAAQLLHIVEKCAGHSGKLGALSNAAMTALMKINDDIKAKATEDNAAAEKQRLSHEAVEVMAATRAEYTGDVGGNVRPKVYPSGSQTETIADRRL